MSPNDSSRNGSGIPPVATAEPTEPRVSQEAAAASQSAMSDGKEKPATRFATRADAKSPTDGIDKGKLVLLGGGWRWRSSSLCSLQSSASLPGNIQ